MMTNREIRQFAWRQLKHNWSAAIASSLLSTFCMLLLLLGISCASLVTAVGAAALVGSGLPVPLLFPAAGIVIALLYVLLLYFSTGFSLGMLRINLRIARGEKIHARDIFSGLTDFRHLWHFAWVYILLNLGSVALHLPAELVSSIYGSGSSNAHIMMVVCNVLAVVYALVLSMSELASADAPERGAWQSIRVSCRIMRCRKLKLVGLFCSFAPWLLLSAVTFGIGYLFMIPYLTVSEAIFFLSAYSEEYLNGDDRDPQENVGGAETADTPAGGFMAAEEPGSAENPAAASAESAEPAAAAGENIEAGDNAAEGKPEELRKAFDEVYRDMLEARAAEKKDDAWESYERWKKEHPLPAPAAEAAAESEAAPKALAEETAETAVISADMRSTEEGETE